MMEDKALQYKIDAINTLSEERLGLMLFEAALRNAKLCQEAIASQDWTQTVKHGRLVQDIMVNLADAINRDHPNADVMRQLYLYCWRQAINAQMAHRVSDLDPVITVISNLIQGIRGFLESSSTSSKNVVGQEASVIDFAG